jgi:hypothetical protein
MNGPISLLTLYLCRARKRRLRQATTSETVLRAEVRLSEEAPGGLRAVTEYSAPQVIP